jgi:hypothetical protein
VGSGGSLFPLITRGKLSKITMIITLPAISSLSVNRLEGRHLDLHLVIKHFRLAGFGFGNQRLIQNVKNISADLFQLCLDFLTILADFANMLIGAFGLLFLLDTRNNSPRGTASANDILVCHRQQVTFVDGKLPAQLTVTRFSNYLKRNDKAQRPVDGTNPVVCKDRRTGLEAVFYLCNLLQKHKSSAINSCFLPAGVAGESGVEGYTFIYVTISRE